MPTKPGGKNGTKYLTPKSIWQHFVDYKTDIKDNPKLKQDFVGKDANEVERKLERPLTFEGFENWLADKNVICDLGDYSANSDNKYQEFIPVMKRIRRVIREDQIEGGMIGNYNPNITQRINGLVEKTENKHEVSEIVIKHES